MKKILLVILVIVAARYFIQGRQRPVDDSQNPEVIANPMYAEIHWSMDAIGRSFEQVLYAKTANKADCDKYSQETIKSINEGQASDVAGKWQVKSSDCKTELADRYAILFDNKPSSLTYLSMARGARREREARVIFWGISVEESDKVCNGLSKKLQRDRKGAVTCIRP